MALSGGRGLRSAANRSHPVPSRMPLRIEARRAAVAPSAGSTKGAVGGRCHHYYRTSHAAPHSRGFDTGDARRGTARVACVMIDNVRTLREAMRCVATLIAGIALVACTPAEREALPSVRPTEGRTEAGGEVLSPAPRGCPLGIMRATALPASSLDKAIDGHVPTWLPDGFGLVGALGPPSQYGPDFAAEAVWADNQCREIDLIYWNRIEGVHRFPDKPRVGDWFVIVDKPGACSNAVLGEARCLGYFSQPESAGIRVQLSVSMMGVSRRTGDAIVRSIAV
jgi:hypothetical protein